MEMSIVVDKRISSEAFAAIWSTSLELVDKNES